MQGTTGNADLIYARAGNELVAAAPQFNSVRIAQRAMGRGLPERDMQVSRSTGC